MNFKTFSQSLEQFLLSVGQNNFGNKIPFLTYSGPPGLQGPPGPKGEQGLKGNIGEVESDFKGPVSKYYQPLIPTQ